MDSSQDRTEGIFEVQPDEEHLREFSPWHTVPPAGEPQLARYERLEHHMLDVHPWYLVGADSGTDPNGAYGLNDAHREAHYDESRKEGQS